MAIIRWNPWSIDRFFDEGLDLPTIPGISRLAGQGLNLYETKDAIIAEAAVPGIPEEKIEVTIDDDIVRITGTQEEKREERDKKRYFMSSLDSSFAYSFRLPQGVISDEEPRVEVEHGLLKITFSKTQKQEPKKLIVTPKKQASKK